MLIKTELKTTGLTNNIRCWI